MVTDPVATLTLPVALLVTVNVTPPAGAGAGIWIGSEAVWPYGTFRVGGTLIFRFCTSTVSAPAVFPAAVASKVAVPGATPVMVADPAVCPCGMFTTAGATVKTPVLLLTRDTAVPPAGAGWFNVTFTPAVSPTPTPGIPV